MPYDPQAIDQSDRERSYYMVWAGAACSLLTFANAFLGWDNLLTALALGGAVGGLLIGVLAYRTDDYFRSMADVGLRWAVFVIAFYLLAAFLLEVMDIAYSAGAALSNPEGEPETRHFALFWTDARTLAAATAVAFHAGYAFAWAKNRMEG